MHIRCAVWFLIVAASSFSNAATINVKSSGARGDGITDDTAAINNAIANSSARDTIYFPAGTYKISFPPGLVLQSDRTFLGDTTGESKLIGTGGYPLATSIYENTYNILVSNLTFEGGGIRLDGHLVPPRSVRVTHCTFKNIVTNNENWTTHMGIYINTGAEFATFDHNHFYNIFTDGKYDLTDRDATGIFGYGLSHSSITDNIFDYMNEGIHIFFDITDGTDVTIARNRFTRLHRITIELQDNQTNGLTVQDNSVSKPLNPYWLTYGMSIAATTTTGRGIVIQNNIIVADTPIDLSVNPKNYYPYGLEAWGTNTTVSNNRIIGLWGIGIGIGTAQNMLVEDNLICGKVATYGKGIDQYYGPQPGTQLVGNTISATCPPDAATLVPSARTATPH